MSDYLTNLLQDVGDLHVTNLQCPPGKGNYRSTSVEPGTIVYDEIVAAMKNTIKNHRGNRGGVFRSYKILKIERIGNQSLMDRYNSYKRDVVRPYGANERMLFHGTSDIFKIVHHGFDKSEANPNGMFGGGFYFTDVSSKANQYVNGGQPCQKHNNHSCYICPRTLLLCRVLLGNSKKLTVAKHFDTAPPGFHSVTGVPSYGGLKHKEYVVYKSQQVYPEFMITYQICK